MTEYMAVWLVYDKKSHSKKRYDTIRDFVYDTKRGCNFLAKKAKKGCMTQKCMTQNVRPFGRDGDEAGSLYTVPFSVIPLYFRCMS